MNPIQDSLDNLSNLQVNRQRQLLAQVKQQFARGLQKLQMAQTREIAISELKKLIEHYREQEYLRSYIAIMKTLKPNSSSATKEHQILVVSIIAQTYKQQLLDPADKPPSLLKTAFRMVEILLTYFNDHSPTVQQACARALLDLNLHCLGAENIQAVFSIVYSPLISILKSGVDKGSQATASACLSQLVKYNRKTGAQELLKKLSPEILGAILKINSQYHELFQAVLGMLESQGINFLQGKTVAFLSKMISVIDGTRELQSTNTTNLNAYMCKVNVCKMIEKIGKLLPLPQKEKLFELRIPEALQQAARHRIIQVQLAATKALKAWKGEETQQSPPKTRGLMSLQQKRNSKKAERSRSRQDRQKAQNQLTFMKQDLAKLVKGGWGASNRAKNYVKRGSGVGGGHISKAELSPQSKSGGKSHKEHLEQLRQFIKKGAEQNKNIDRFVGLLGKQIQKRSHSPSPPPRNKQGVRSKSPQPQRGKSQGQHINKKQQEHSGDEFFEAEQAGQQMVYQPQPQKKSVPHSKPTSKQHSSSSHSGSDTPDNRFADIGMSKDEVLELKAHEKSLLNQGKQMNIDYTDIDQQRIETKQPTMNKHPVTAIQQVRQIPTSQKQSSSLQKNYDHILTFQGLSQQQLQQLVEQNNLSQVSQNLNGILSQSDFKGFNSSRPQLLDSRILEPTQQGQSAQSQSKVIKQAIDKFKKSDIMTEKEEKAENQISFRKTEKQPVQTPPETAKENIDQPAVSLNFTQSQQSKVKSPPQRENNFTLNPKEKFSTLKQSPKLNQKQIQQQIAMSQYEETFPRDQPLPVIIPKVSPISHIPLRHQAVPYNLQHSSPAVKREEFVPKRVSPPSAYDKKQEQVPEAKADYQNIIKNPPKLLRNNQPSRVKASKVTEKSYPQQSNVQAQGEERENIGTTWLNILDKTNQGDVNDSFDEVINLDDPIYLLRLMLLSKLPVRKLSPDVFRKVWRKFMQIYSQKFIDTLTVGLLSQGNQLNLLSKCLSVQQLQQTLVGLYQLSGSSKGKLSYRAATLYNQIQKKLHSE